MPPPKGWVMVGDVPLAEYTLKEVGMLSCHHFLLSNVPIIIAYQLSCMSDVRRSLADMVPPPPCEIRLIAPALSRTIDYMVADLLTKLAYSSVVLYLQYENMLNGWAKSVNGMNSEPFWKCTPRHFLAGSSDPSLIIFFIVV